MNKSVVTLRRLRIEREVRYVRSAVPTDGVLKLTIMVNSYNDTTEGYPLANIRRWYWKER